MDLSLRLFVAIQLTGAVREQLSTSINSLRQERWAKHIHWVRPENLHLTLRFIGSYPLPQIAGLVEQITTSIHEIVPFQIHFGNLRLFPSHHKARVIVASVVPNSSLTKLAQALEQSAVACGLPASTRAYLPHVSLGRLTHRIAAEEIHLPPTEIASYWIQQIALLHSEEHEGKRFYHPLNIIPLNRHTPFQIELALIIQQQQRILLIRTSNNQWTLPSGSLQLGETLHAAATRIAQTILGIEIQIETTQGVAEIIENYEANGPINHHLIIGVKANYLNGLLKVSTNIIEMQWFALNKLEQLPLTASTQQLLLGDKNIYAKTQRLDV